MLVAISVNHAAHQHQHGQAFKKGFERHGIQTVFTHGDIVVHEADIHVCWSVKRRAIMSWHQGSGKPVLIAERGHLGDRMKYTSCGWNGLGRRGRYPQAPNADRWKSLWSHLLEPWKDSGIGTYVLLIGQIEGDASLYDLKGGFDLWAQQQTKALRKLGYSVVFRPHPLMASRGFKVLPPEGATLSRHKRLADDLKGATLAVSFNSTAGVECVLAGVPTITLDAGAMAWDVAGHTLTEIVRPEREAWAVGLSYTQWTLKEIADGTAWEHLRGCSTV